MGDLSEALEGASDWIGVVHADGNGIGQLLVALGGETANGSAESYWEDLSKLSAAIDGTGVKAFAQALGETPAVPLILGGDDLTVLLRGQDALPFAVRYLKAFDELTGGDPDISRLAPDGRLAACAGVAIVKRSHPFSAAYELAEQLADSAKRVKRRVVTREDRTVACSALDFHVLYDSTGAQLPRIRRQLERPDAVMHGRPYVVTALGALSEASSDAQAWARARDVQMLDTRVRALEEAREDTAGRNQILAMRAALQETPSAASARAAGIVRRHPALAAHLDGEDGELFVDVPDARDGTPRPTSRLLDVLDAHALTPGGLT